MRNEQRRLYALLPSGARCFVRVCDDDCALWVSDLPRKYEACQSLIPALEEAGFLVMPDEQSRLWYIDRTKKRWLEMLEELPSELPALPEKDEWHEVYALCRLLLLHPARMENDHLPLIRRAFKLKAGNGSAARSVRSMREKTALSIRCGRTSAYAAGRVLAAWLLEHKDTGKETKP